MESRLHYITFAGKYKVRSYRVRSTKYESADCETEAAGRHLQTVASEVPLRLHENLQP